MRHAREALRVCRATGAMTWRCADGRARLLDSVATDELSGSHALPPSARAVLDHVDDAGLQVAVACASPCVSASGLTT
jgi:hypothetical protein